MSDDYLWDGSGEPDPEVRRLEDLLGRYGHKAPEAASSPAVRSDEETDMPRGRWTTPRTTPTRARAAPRGRFATVLALPLAAALLLAAVWMLRSGRSATPGWEIVRVEGAPILDAQPIAENGKMRVGAWLETDARSRATIRVGMIGEADLEPGTRVRLVSAGLTDHRLALARGTLHARIWAPPRLFYVETPSALAIDLGCAYTLTVDEAGESLLKVETGWVAFEHEGRESFVPAGALCVTRPVVGPGTPCFEDVSPRFREALMHLDFASPQPSLGSGTASGTRLPEGRAEFLGVVLSEARRKDALTLWHLLSRLEGDERARVYDRMAALVPPPADVTREAVLRGDREMIDRWWDRLGLGVTTWWRLWKSPEPRLAR